MNIGIIYAIIALFSWGIHGPAGRYLALQGVDMYFVFAVRFWIGTLVFFCYLLIKKSVKLDLKDHWKDVLIISSVGIIGNSLLYHVTLIYLPGTLVMILENLAPVFVLLASYFLLKVKATKIEIISLVLSFMGILLIVFGKSSFPELGDGFYKGIVLGVLTGLTFGAYIYYSAELVKPYKLQPIKIIQFLFKIFLISSIVCTPFIIKSGHKPDSTTEWFWLLEMGVFQSGLSYLFWNYALAHLRTNTASILFLLTILFTTLNEVVFLHLRLNSYLIFGGLLIVIAGTIISTSKKSVASETPGS